MKILQFNDGKIHCQVRRIQQGRHSRHVALNINEHKRGIIILLDYLVKYFPQQQTKKYQHCFKQNIEIIVVKNKTKIFNLCKFQCVARVRYLVQNAVFIGLQNLKKYVLGTQGSTSLWPLFGIPSHCHLTNTQSHCTVFYIIRMQFKASDTCRDQTLVKVKRRSFQFVRFQRFSKSFRHNKYRKCASRVQKEKTSMLKTSPATTLASQVLFTTTSVSRSQSKCSFLILCDANRQQTPEPTGRVQPR